MTEEADTPAVGYGKPPREHRFKKGQSGNPSGRPPGARNKVDSYKPALKPTDDLILQEAYRPVTIREGDRSFELPAVQAAVRALAISAMKGSGLSQRALAELVQGAEERKGAEQKMVLENAFDYKLRWTAELERRRRCGSNEPDPIPHPDDIIIDMRTGKVRTEGPLDKREKDEWDLRLARRAEAAQRVSSYAEKFYEAQNSQQRRQWRDKWYVEQYVFDIINDSLPMRYRTALENRSFAEGVSTEGNALAEFQKL